VHIRYSWQEIHQVNSVCIYTVLANPTYTACFSFGLSIQILPPKATDTDFWVGNRNEKGSVWLGAKTVHHLTLMRSHIDTLFISYKPRLGTRWDAAHWVTCLLHLKSCMCLKVTCLLQFMPHMCLRVTCLLHSMSHMCLRPNFWAVHQELQTLSVCSWIGEFPADPADPAAVSPQPNSPHLCAPSRTKQLSLVASFLTHIIQQLLCVWSFTSAWHLPLHINLMLFTYTVSPSCSLSFYQHGPLSLKQ